MADKIQVKPTPIQRNAQDVAIELLNIYLSNQSMSDKDMEIDELRELYLKFYATAELAGKVHFKYLKQYIPEDLKEVAELF